MFVALLDHSGREGKRVGQGEVGTGAAKRLPRGTLTPAAISRHFNGRMPSVATVAAYAAEMGVDPGWLAFGELSEAPAPDIPAAKLAEQAERSEREKRKPS
jgi:hypothetical protein